MAALRDLESADPSAIRERVIRVMADVGEGEGAAFWSLGQTDRGIAPTCLHLVGVSAREAYWRGLSGMDVADPLVDPRRPRRESANRFDPAIASGWARKLEASPLYDSVWRPLGLGDQLRAFIFHGGRFVGTLAAGRFVRAIPFNRRDAARAGVVLPALTAALLTAHAAERVEGHADIVTRADGRVELASADAERWLSRPGFRERVAALVRALERGKAEAPDPLAFASVRWSRLHGSAGHSYLLHVAPAPLVRVVPDSVLSRTQRRAAEYLAAGATVAETATSMGIGPETVRTHLREVYRRLGIGSRAELARALRAG